MDAADTEQRVARLSEPLCRRILDIPSPAWLSQHSSVEALSVMAHTQARTASHAHVLDTLLTSDRYDVLVKSLLATHLWRCHVLPCLPPAALAGDALTRVYFVLYHECVCAQFIALTLYHDYVCDAAPFRDVVDDLTDYAVKCVNNLIAAAQARKAGRGRGGVEGVPVAGDDASTSQLRAWLEDMNLKRGCACVTILRYLMEHSERLPISVTSRLLDTHDVLLSAAALIENPPWVRKVTRTPAAGGAAAAAVVWQKYDGNAWTDVAPADLLRVTPVDAQPWLMIFAMVRTPSLRGRYAMHGHRLSALSRVRKYMNEVLNDQIPVLNDVQRWLDELSIAGGSAASGTGNLNMQAGLLVTDVVTTTSRMVDDALGRVAPAREGDTAQDRSGMLFITAVAAAPAEEYKSTDTPVYTRSWTDVAAHVATTHLLARSRDDLKALANVYGDDAFEEAAGLSPRCALCGAADAHKRCSRCRNAFYCSRECQVKDWNAHKPMCDVVMEARPAERLEPAASLAPPVMPLVMPAASTASLPKASAPVLVKREAVKEGKEEEEVEAAAAAPPPPAAASRRMLIQELP